jgi:hypothetical protein
MHNNFVPKQLINNAFLFLVKKETKNRVLSTDYKFKFYNLGAWINQTY